MKKICSNHILYICSLSLIGLVALSGLVLSSATALADTSTVSTASVTVSETCMMTGTLDTPHAAKLVNGTYSGLDYEDGIGQTTLKVFCNDGAGFAIYAIGYTNDEYGNNYLHWNKATSASDHTEDIATGIYNSNSTVNSTWSMKLAAVSGTYAATIDDGVQAHNDSTEDYTNWHEVPDEYQRVAYRTSGTDVEVSGVGIGSSITVTYDSYVSGTQSPGTYVGQVKYTLVHPNNAAAPMLPLDPAVVPANTITYAPNASDIIGSMSSLPDTTTTLTNASPQAGAISVTANSTARLIAPNYKREGYGFAGWSTEFDAATATNPTIYGPNETISTNPTNGGLNVTGGVVLYPVWIESKGDLQEWTGCSNLEPVSYNVETGELSATLDSITALTDTRDGNVYTVARLADGLCWMVENLRLNNEHSTSPEDIAKAQGYGDDTANNRGRFIGLADSEDANFADYNTTANTLYSTDGSNNTINIGTSDYPVYRIPRYNNNNTNMATGATNSDGTTTLEDKYNYYNDSTKDNHLRWYSYGNYYNWPATMASTTYYSAYSGTTGSDAANTSLCPLGWHLPLGNQSTGTLTGTVADDALDLANRVGGFSYLDRRMGGTGQNQSSIAGITQSTLWRKFPNNFVYSGYWSGAQAKERGLGGRYWSSSAGSYHNASNHEFTNSSIYPATTIFRKYYGLTVRCVNGF